MHKNRKICCFTRRSSWAVHHLRLLILQWWFTSLICANVSKAPGYNNPYAASSGIQSFWLTDSTCENWGFLRLLLTQDDSALCSGLVIKDLFLSWTATEASIVTESLKQRVSKPGRNAYATIILWLSFITKECWYLFTAHMWWFDLFRPECVFKLQNGHDAEWLQRTIFAEVWAQWLVQQWFVRCWMDIPKARTFAMTLVDYPRLLPKVDAYPISLTEQGASRER